MHMKRHDLGISNHIAAYSDVIETTSNLRWLYSAGTPGITADGQFPPDIETQSRLAWASIMKALEVAGMDRYDLVKVSTTLTSAAYIPAYRKVREEVMGDARPAFMLSVVTQMIKPEILVEIEIIAAKPSASVPPL